MKQRLFHRDEIDLDSPLTPTQQMIGAAQRLIDQNGLDETKLEYHVTLEGFSDGRMFYEVRINVPGINWPNMIWFLACMGILLALLVGVR